MRATDLRLLVNGLWRAGAEAIAINGRRLSAISAIVNSNISVQVNRSPLTPPYVVSAIGDDTLAGQLQASTSGVQFQALADQFGFVVDRQNESELAPPGGARHPAAAALRRAGERWPRQPGGPAVIAVLGLVVGIVLGLVLRPDVPLALDPYLPIAVVAALDAVFGGLRAYLDGIFDDKVFVISFVSNVVIASGIVFLGDKLGVGGQLSTGVIVVLGIRIFSNVAAIRRHLFHA